MNSELYLKASELAEAIHNSPEAIEVREAEKKSARIRLPIT